MVLLESSRDEMGWELKEFELPNVDGSNFSSKDIDKSLVLVAFICNHCPYVIKIIKDFSQLAKNHADSTQFVAISANDPDYREEDSFENMKLFAKDHDFIFPYLFDESQEVAKAYGAVCTPDLFLFKKLEDQYKLVYHGKFESLNTAINELKESHETSFAQHPSIGCSIKWKDDSDV